MCACIGVRSDEASFAHTMYTLNVDARHALQGPLCSDFVPGDNTMSQNFNKYILNKIIDGVS